MAIPTIVNPSFSSPALASNNTTATTTDGWSLGSTAVVWRIDPNQWLNIGNNSATAWAQQTLSFPTSGSFKLHFGYGRRGQSGSIICGAYIDGSLIWSAATPAGADNTFPMSVESTTFAATAGDHVLRIAAISNSSGFQAVFDGFSITEVSTAQPGQLICLDGNAVGFVG